MIRHLLVLPLTALVACASGPHSEDPCAAAMPPTAGWTVYDEGAFTIQLPPSYARVDVQGIDSQVGRWEAPGKRITYDLGFHSHPLQQDEVHSYPGLVVCQESEGPGTARIIRYTPPEGGHAFSAQWPDLRREASGMAESLALDALFEQEADHGEILAVIRSVRIETTAPGTAGVEAPSTGAEGAGGARETPPASSPGHAGYRASGNEPFWTLTLDETTMGFFLLGREDTLRATRPDPERLADGWRFNATSGGQPFVVLIREGRCNDSMSGRPFPHSVTVSVAGRTYTGCGGDTMSLLAGEEWTVTHLEDRSTRGRQPPTMLFTSDGVLTGHGGCNRFGGRYELTGEGMSIGPAQATRMACLDAEANAQETRFFALLEQVTRFDIRGDGSLELLAGDRPVIVARR
jgi:heat shock protein HslJ